MCHVTSRSVITHSCHHDHDDDDDDHHADHNDLDMTVIMIHDDHEENEHHVFQERSFLGVTTRAS
jgi:hypothetical protein